MKKSGLERRLVLDFNHIVPIIFSPSTATSRRLSLMRKPAPSSLFTAFVVLASVFAFVTVAQIAFGQEPEPAPAPPGIPTPVYRPKYHGDPAHSDSEFAALAYMRVVMRAQLLFNKHYGHYATTLAQLNHTGTFTQRMINPDRGDYTVGFKGKKDGYILTMTPKLLDAQHRSFYAEEDGKIHADETKAADGDSPVVETHRW
jgi:hypothetical protein